MSVAWACCCVGGRRQAPDKRLACQRARSERDKAVVGLVSEERCHQPRIDMRKLLHLLKLPLDQAGIQIGRNALFGVLCEARMLVRPLHVYHKTTHSHHHYRRHANLFKEGWAKTVASGCAQLWVADMTYLPTKEKAACLMVTDACSRKIVGWHVMECLLQRPADIPLARTMVCESVRLYNERRPHGSVLLTIGGGRQRKSRCICMQRLVVFGAQERTRTSTELPAST